MLRTQAHNKRIIISNVCTIVHGTCSTCQKLSIWCDRDSITGIISLVHKPCIPEAIYYTAAVTQTIATFNSTSTPSIERGGKLTARLALWHERLAAMLLVTDLVSVQNKHLIFVCPTVEMFVNARMMQAVFLV